jgi:glucose/arabinose dehydrogenase
MNKSVGVLRLLWLVGLAALAAVIALVMFTRSSESAPSVQSCTAPAYEKGALYEQGQQVQHADQLFECWKDDEAPSGVGSWQWCKLPVYEPLVVGGPWKDAWKELGECGGFEGNRLTLSFSTLSGKAPLKPAVKGVARADQTVTGTLRCKAEEIAISAKANETIHLDNLKACDYQLVMNSADGYIPLNTPRIVSFKEAQGAEQTVAVKYRPPVEVSKLNGLPGIKIELFAQGLIQPRQMAMGKNVLYVGSSAIPSYVYDGKIGDMIYALPLDGAGKPTGIHVIASGLEEPHGVAYRDGDLYYSTTGGLYRLRNADDHYKDPKPELVFSFPADGKLFPLPPLSSGSNTRIWHMKHPLRFNPVDPSDKWLYTAVGTPCNLCMIPADKRYGTVLRYSLETGESEILAMGVRNSVGFDWNPKDGKIWFSDNNRQGFPNPDEVNVIRGPGLHFGVPYRFGRDTPGFTQEEYQNPGVIQPPLVPGAIVSDKSLEQIHPADYVPAAFESGTNTAPLGVKFWSGYPAAAGTQRLLVAVHGAGSTARPGMDIQMLTIQGGTRVVNQIPLINGFVQDPDRFDVYCLDNSCIGRPVEFLELADGSLLISDDVAGVIYRVRYDATGLPETELALRPMLSPPGLEDEMISGYLIAPDGNSRLVQLSWDPLNNESALTLKGLAYGEYQLRLNDVKKWIPLVRNTSFTLSPTNKSQAINLRYRERPIKLAVEITINAPSKPASVTDDQWHISLVNEDQSHAKPLLIQIPWGASTTQILDYGKYKVIYPFYSKEKPEPELESVVIDESSEDRQLPLIAYRHVENLGESVLAGACTKCHSVEYFDSAAKALIWSAADREVLVNQIKSMPVSGHCDTTCATEISHHLFDVIWKPYLDQSETYGARQLRLLTPSEYAASIRDILGVEVSPEKLPADKSEKDFKYPGEASKGILQAEDVKLFYDMALSVAEKVAPARLSALATSRTGTDLVTSLGYQMFRRPVTDAERLRYQKIHDEQGAPAVIAALLMSPHFLYRSELGVESATASKVYKLTPFELVTALSYGFLGTTPDVELLAKAQRNELQTSQQISAEIQRMMQTDRGIEQFNRFVSYYIKTARGVQEKPGLTKPMIALMAQEQYLLSKSMLLDSGTLDKLFNPGYTYLNQDLAAHYGISGVAGSTMQKVAVDDKRGGLLHLGLTQAATSDFETTSLVKRGIMIREQMFCREFGAPVEPDPTGPVFPAQPITTRERWDLVNGEQASGGRCWQCHQFMNDTGAAMEHYDAAGRYRTQEKAYNFDQYPQMLPIKASGPFLTSTGSETINDVRGIAKIVPRHPASQFCMADSYFRFVFGSKSDASTSGVVKAIADGLKKSGSLEEMLRTLGTSNAFIYKTERN